MALDIKNSDGVRWDLISSTQKSSTVLYIIPRIQPGGVTSISYHHPEHSVFALYTLATVVDDMIHDGVVFDDDYLPTSIVGRNQPMNEVIDALSPIEQGQRAENCSTTSTSPGGSRGSASRTTRSTSSPASTNVFGRASRSATVSGSIDTARTGSRRSCVDAHSLD